MAYMIRQVSALKETGRLDSAPELTEPGTTEPETTEPELTKPAVAAETRLLPKGCLKGLSA